MKATLTVLGSGTSMGVPTIGCDCAVCHSSDPRDQRLRASLYMETPECSWVVDTGPDFRTQVLRANIRKVDAAVFTHSHTDHFGGVKGVVTEDEVRAGKVKIFAPDHFMDYAVTDNIGWSSRRASSAA